MKKFIKIIALVAVACLSVQLAIAQIGNTNYGEGAGLQISAGGNYNSNFGNTAGYYISTGRDNNNFGRRAGHYNTTGIGNSNFGYEAGYYNSTGNGNVTLGTQAGRQIRSGSYNVLIGFGAGYFLPEDASNTLFIENSQSLDHPLIYGKFDENRLGIATNNLVPHTTLTVSGAVHISPKNANPKIFHQEHADNYLLWVEKGIVSEDFVIEEAEGWSDFVFKEDYELRSLTDLSAFIKSHGHLPEMPSEAEVMSEGYSMHDINKKLLQKVEELVLYTIMQEEKLTTQKAEMQSINDRLSNLEKKMR